jgi:hypothetical protein
MTSTHVKELRRLEGQRITLVMLDGSHIPDAILVSAGGGCTRTVWLDVDGIDVFVPTGAVRNGWEHQVVSNSAA